MAVLQSFLSVLLASTAFGAAPGYGEHSQVSKKRALPDYAQRNLNTIQKIYNITVYPNNMPIVNEGAKAVPPGLFNEKATGRVNPVGNFSGFDDSIEYFFALAPVPQQEQGLAFYKAEVVEFTSGCPEVASSLVYLRTGHVDPQTGELDDSKQKTTLAQVAFWRFDDQGRVLKYHAWIPNLEKWTHVAIGQDFTNLLTQKVTSAVLCPTIQKMCSGNNKQYANTLDCIAKLERKPFGSFDEAWGDNIACRIIHLILTKVRPEVHCPHVGPVGGSPPDNYKCVDIDYSIEYFNDAELFGAPEGDVFSCGGPLLGAMKML
ncbi:hypothetical protein AC578_6589 [Pseudocercospora eumusae]|uniref:SnoaL-like domain-containing protein n=1 Tax=Pseudocercospora eumusae TaxID=321146 RepID=A0A139GW06_9PEZI|nr:hypothetical protein AC578_6589 [Pseudocercospora eumusae]